MSADLFAVFGSPGETTAREQLDEIWASPKGDLASTATHALEPQSIPRVRDVLFDADEAEIEDEFGDFEDPQAATKRAIEPDLVQKQLEHEPTVVSLSQQVDLLDLETEVTPGPVQGNHYFLPFEATKETHTKNAVVDDWGDFEDFAQEAQPEPRILEQDSSSHVLAHAATLEPVQSVAISREDEWEGFEEWNANQPSDQEMTGNDTTTATTYQSTEMPNEPRPANIPPPTILLQLLPEVFQFLQDQAKALHETLNTIDETAASIVTVFAVAARIIAGRALRWKRDTYLAQSTRIGPSTSGARGGGMKLASVNRSEALREEREAADVCDAWSRNTHIFAGVVSSSAHRRPWMNLSVKMTARPSPAGFGTLEAREACALCGVKRDERIAGVDFDADDVFDEYWTEHWGHTDCRVFWYTYRHMLDHR